MKIQTHQGGRFISILAHSFRCIYTVGNYSDKDEQASMHKTFVRLDFPSLTGTNPAYRTAPFLMLGQKEEDRALE